MQQRKFFVEKHNDDKTTVKCTKWY